MENVYLNIAVELVKAQFPGQGLSPEDMLDKIEKTAKGLSALDGNSAEPEPAVTGGLTLVADPKTAVKGDSITCCVCGGAYKVITRTHLALHGLTPGQYRELCGYAPRMSLVCKNLCKARADKMRSMELWKRRKGEPETEVAPDEAGLVDAASL